LLAAAYLGVKPKGAAPQSVPQASNEAALSALSVFPGLSQGNPHDGLGEAVLDFAELKRLYSS
jgi:hypothetical protein